VTVNNIVLIGKKALSVVGLPVRIAGETFPVISNILKNVFQDVLQNVFKE
jgi:hypothetical protein